MANVAFRPVESGDIEYIAANMREADQLEIRACRGEHVVLKDALARAVLVSSHVWAATSLTGTPIALFGVSPVSILMGVGSPWFISTEEAYRYPRALVVEGRKYLDKMRAVYPNLYNHVDARNVRSIRWLARLGFQIGPPTPHGATGVPFRRFEIKESNYVS